MLSKLQVLHFILKFVENVTVIGVRSIC